MWTFPSRSKIIFIFQFFSLCLIHCRTKWELTRIKVVIERLEASHLYKCEVPVHRFACHLLTYHTNAKIFHSYRNYHALENECFFCGGKIWTHIPRNVHINRRSVASTLWSIIQKTEEKNIISFVWFLLVGMAGWKWKLMHVDTPFNHKCFHAISALRQVLNERCSPTRRAAKLPESVDPKCGRVCISLSKLLIIFRLGLHKCGYLLKNHLGRRKTKCLRTDVCILQHGARMGTYSRWWSK